MPAQVSPSTQPPVGPRPGSAPPVAPFSELTARRLGPVRRYFVRHPVAMDLVVMGLFAAVAAVDAVLGTVLGEVALPDTVIGVAAGASGVGVLFWRRRAPVLVCSAVLGLLVTTVVVTGQTVSFDVALAFTVYAVAASRPVWAAWSVMVTTVAVTSLTVWFWGTRTSVELDDVGQRFSADPRPSTVAGIVFLALVALAVGTSVRNRRLHVADLVERANALARDRDQQAQLARAGERSRIAREMHDVVAHSLSVMIALSDGAGAALDRSPDKARTALDELSETGRTALADMRRVLGVLDTDAPLEPQPGTPDLSELVGRFRAAGLPVRTQGMRTPIPDDTGLQLAVYRIVQEGLTNALRHAPGTTGVDLALTGGPDRLTIEVIDHGSAAASTESPGAGRGLIGMRERAGVYGGTVEAGPWRGGWRVLAVLPWRKDGS